MVGAEWVNRFTSECKQPKLQYCDDCALGFVNAMVSRGHYRAFVHGDSDAWEEDWRSYWRGGKDYIPGRGASTVNFAWLSTHGVSNSNHFTASFATRHGYCLWDNNTGVFGNLSTDTGSLRWVVFDCCESLNLPNPQYKWHHCFYGLHIVIGFTGLCSDASWTGDRGYRFGRRAGAGAKLADAWLDEAYSYWCDDNPVAMACGVDASDAKNRVFNERITTGEPGVIHDTITYYWWRWRE